MKVRCINNNWNNLTKGKVYDVIHIIDSEIQIYNDSGNKQTFYIGNFEVIKEENKMQEKTFREVIADIKEGEVWECGHILITKSNDGIELKGMSSYSSYFTDDNKIFKPQRKEYTFEEAFKAYEDGKEIESCYSGDKYMIQHGGSDCYADGSKTGTIGFNEIRGKWYINN
ncbi:MAG: hypothetical protein E6583_07475 [Clostridium sp.]|nr:hypothetical protein [Clostridium celatum]MDU6341163.1 hypothetical protein [Clostridium sp.]